MTTVPETATMLTADQYSGAQYRRARSCSPSASARPPTLTTPPSTRLTCARPSEAASPIPVVSTLTSQKVAVTAGTFAATGVGRRQAARRAGELVVTAGR